MAATNKTIKIESLPPSEHAAYQHLFRVYQQVMDWKHLEESHYDPSNWGWDLRNESYHPIFTDQPAAPNDLLQFIRWKCKLTSKNPCGTNVSCKKNGLHCVAACGNCIGDGCRNEAPLIIFNDEESFEERNIFDIFD